MVTINQIKQLSSQIGHLFRVDRIILFGSYAAGSSTEDSDVDLLVVMDHEGKGWQMATEIRGCTRPRFPLDLLVRTAEQLRRRLTMGDCFFKEITEKGMVLYEGTDK